MKSKQEKSCPVSDFVKQQASDKQTLYFIRLLSRFNNDCSPTFDEVTPAFLESFRDFLVKKNLKASTVCSLLYLLRSFFVKAIKAGITENFPFSDFRIGAKRSFVRPYYTSSQVKKLEQTKTPFKQCVRDIYLFALYTGIDSSELRRLTIVQTKQMKLSGKAAELFDKITKGRINKDDEHLFKGLPQQFDYLLRLWGALAGLELRPNFLIARNSYIMNALAHGRTLKSVMTQLGIKHKRSFEAYQKMHDERKRTLSPRKQVYSDLNVGLQPFPVSVK